jgi:hypothetical protein
MVGENVSSNVVAGGGVAPHSRAGIMSPDEHTSRLTCFVRRGNIHSTDLGSGGQDRTADLRRMKSALFATELHRQNFKRDVSRGDLSLSQSRTWISGCASLLRLQFQLAFTVHVL